MKKEKVLTKSPIEEKPLRYPAQSLDEKIDNLISDRGLVYFLVPAIMIMVAMISWVSYFDQKLPNPWLYSSIAFITLVWSIYKIYHLKQEIKLLKQGRDGEREVGMNLELLREQGFKVYHDIVCKDFNLDHILIGKKGIFVIETKTFSKPQSGQCKITFDGEKLSYNGTYESDKPIIQARAGVNWLKNYIKETTNKDFNVFSIVVFPGWFTESKATSNDIWVLNPKGLTKYMQNKKDEILEEDVALISNRIELYIRSFEYKRATCRFLQTTNNLS